MYRLQKITYGVRLDYISSLNPDFPNSPQILLLFFSQVFSVYTRKAK